MMPQNETAHAMVRQYEYADRIVTVADLGSGTDPVVDVVDGTAIVVTGDDQHEIDVPAGDVQAFNRNGVVTLEVRK